MQGGDDHHVPGELDAAGRAALEGDGAVLEVVQHVQDGGKVEVLNSALAPLRQGKPQVLPEEPQETLPFDTLPPPLDSPSPSRAH